MSDSQERPWSDNPNAPKIPYYLYFEEKADFAGVLIGSILYGILVVLFFQCMAALLNPANRKRDGIKWGLVSYTAVMFSFATVLTGMELDIRSISFIDNREFPGADGVAPPGPLGYQSFIWSGALTLVPDLMFILNKWLADALLVHRCYVIYSRNLWVVAFPCLMLLGSFALGIVTLVHQASGVTNAVWGPFASHPTTPYLAVSIPLNILLALMIATRLILYSKNIRAATGAPAGIGGLYKTILTILVESSALYAVSSLLVIGEGGSRIAYIFLPILSETQVIAPLLIVKRVANQNALTGGIVVAAPQISSFTFKRGESIGGGGPPGLGDHRGKNTGELEVGVGVGVATTINLAEESKV